MVNRCVDCEKIIDGTAMSEYKANCKNCDNLYCDSCFEDGSEETASSEWLVFECECGEQILRKN